VCLEEEGRLIVSVSRWPRFLVCGSDLARAIEAGEEFDSSLTKAQASKRIDELQAKTGRGKTVGTPPRMPGR